MGINMGEMMQQFQQFNQMLRASNNPQQMVQQTLGNNPLFARAQQMANGKTDSELEQTARNLCQNMGVDYEEAKQQFQSGGWNFGGAPMHGRRR